MTAHDLEANDKPSEEIAKNTTSEEPATKTTFTLKWIAIASVSTLLLATLLLALTTVVAGLLPSNHLTVTLPLYVAPLLSNGSTAHAHTVVIHDIDGDTIELTVLSATRHNSTVMTFTTTEGEVELFNGLAAFVPKASLGASTRYARAADVRLSHMATPRSNADVEQYEDLIKRAEIGLATVGVPLGSTHSHAALVDDRSVKATTETLIEVPVLTNDPLTQAESEQVAHRLHDMFNTREEPESASGETAGHGGRRLGQAGPFDDPWDCAGWAHTLRGSNNDAYRFITAGSLETPRFCQAPTWHQWLVCNFIDASPSNCINQARSAVRCNSCAAYFKQNRVASSGTCGNKISDEAMCREAAVATGREFAWTVPDAANFPTGCFVLERANHQYQNKVFFKRGGRDLGCSGDYASCICASGAPSVPPVVLLPPTSTPRPAVLKYADAAWHGARCETGTSLITSSVPDGEEKCKAAAAALGLRYARSLHNDGNWIDGCFQWYVGRDLFNDMRTLHGPSNPVYFNRRPGGGMGGRLGGSPICAVSR